MNPIVIDIEDNRAGYLSVVDNVLNHGHIVDSRNGKTLEILGATIILRDPSNALPVGMSRKCNAALGAMEAAQLVGGFSDPETLCKVAPNFVQFMDDGVFHGAYGPRTTDQYPRVIERLRSTPNTRQAVVQVWDKDLDLEEGYRDYPCTLIHAFYIRDDRLVMQTTMRSNDVWWGWAYDAFQFTQLHLTVANVLGIQPGPYIHHSISLHLYERDWQDARDLLINAVVQPTPLDRPLGFTGATWEEARDQARLSVHAAITSDGIANTQPWYVETIAKRLANA